MRPKVIRHQIRRCCLLATLAATVALSAPAKTQSPPAIGVEFFGHTAIRDTPEGRTLMFAEGARETLFVPNRVCADLEVLEGTETVKAGRFAVQDGCQLRDIEGTRQEKTTLSVIDIRSGNPVWQMPIDRSKPQLLEWKRRIWENRIGASLESTVQELRRMFALTIDPEVQMDLLYAITLGEMRLGHNDLAIRHLGEVSHLAVAAHYPSVAFDANYRRVFLLISASMHNEARGVLAQMPSLGTQGDSRSASYIVWEYGLIARSEARFGDAANQLWSTMSATERVHDVEFQRSATPILASALLRTKQVEKAEKLIASMDELLDGENPCVRAGLLSNMAIGSLNIAEHRKSPQGVAAYRVGLYSVRERFSQAVDARLLCRDEQQLANLYSGLARLDFQVGRFSESKLWLEKAMIIDGGTIDDQLENMELSARIALVNGKGSTANAQFIALEELSRSHPDAQRKRFQCSAAVGMLEALSLLGQDATAVSNTVRACIASIDPAVAESDYSDVMQRARRLGLSIQ